MQPTICWTPTSVRHWVTHQPDGQSRYRRDFRATIPLESFARGHKLRPSVSCSEAMPHLSILREECVDLLSQNFPSAGEWSGWVGRGKLDEHRFQHQQASIRHGNSLFAGSRLRPHCSQLRQHRLAVNFSLVGRRSANCADLGVSPSQ